jgi:hypothetical protein
MKLKINFDVTADIINIPDILKSQLEKLAEEFYIWITEHTPEKYQKVIEGLQVIDFRGEAFIEWLNAGVLKDSTEKASMIESCVDVETAADEEIFF